MQRHIPLRLLIAGWVFILVWPIAGVSAQPVEGRWHALYPDGPIARTGGRHDDIHFIDESTGWVVNGRGEVYRTDDGGDDWELIFVKPGVYLRSVSFANTSRGWIGSLTSGNILHETYDGGRSWIPLTDRIRGPNVGGICGIQAISDQVVYGVGAYFGGPWFVRTLNGGQNWTSKIIGTDARTLIDLHFFDEDIGIAVGGTKDISEGLMGDAVVVRTTDGGSTWTEVHRTSHGTGVGGEWGWKISFPTDLVGYVSLEYTQNSTAQEAKYLKTIDGGLTWTEHFIPGSAQPAGLQGIGFITEDIGWASGRGTTSVTTDGGISWQQLADFRPPDVPNPNPGGQLDGRTNRIFVVNSTLAYAVGVYTYKFEGTIPVQVERATPREQPVEFSIDQNYPNPFAYSTEIDYTLLEPLSVRIRVLDVLGRPVTTLVNATEQAAGRYRVKWDGRDRAGTRVAAGMYLFVMDMGDQIEMKRAVLID